VKTKPKVGDLIRREHCPHVGIIVEARGIYVTVRWAQPFWQADRRIETSTFARAQAEILSPA
jgi:hypothetical protein